MAIKMSKERVKKNATSIALNLLVAVFALIVVFPLFVMAITSVKPFGEAMYFSWWPSKISFEAYKFILIPNESTIEMGLSLVRAFRNTLITTIPGTTVGVFVSAASAYVFAKREFTGKKICFTILLSALMLPGAVQMVSMYLIYAKIGWVNTLLPLVVPQMFGTIGLVFAFRQFMYSIPDEMVESARVDGAGEFTILVKMVLPLSKAVICAHWLLQFMNGYNQYIEPLLYIFDPEWETLQLTLSRYTQTVGTSNMPVVMAAAAISMIPLIILYACSQKLFEKGIMTGSIKG